MTQYPEINPWLKLHWTGDHLWLVPEKYGFLGRGNEQGFESFHVRTNNLANVARARLGKEQIAETFQKKMRKSELPNVAHHERLFFESLTKLPNRKKKDVENSPLSSMEDNILQQPTRKEDKFEIIYDGKSYTRLSLKLCPLCNKEYPQLLEGIHMRYTHKMINFATTDNCRDEDVTDD
jgi:hypothetical protein